MATKNNPGTFDCYGALHNDEPFFVLRANDEDAPNMVVNWAANRLSQVMSGARSIESSANKIAEALNCAAQMSWWNRAVKPKRAADEAFEAQRIGRDNMEMHRLFGGRNIEQAREDARATGLSLGMRESEVEALVATPTGLKVLAGMAERRSLEKMVEEDEKGDSVDPRRLSSLSLPPATKPPGYPVARGVTRKSKSNGRGKR